MIEYLFRAEAVNLNSTVYDTSDISTIRGGGFYLLERINELARRSSFKNHVITEGASAAVFKIDTKNPDTVREEMLKYLYTSKAPEAIREMMFLVEYVENKGGFPNAMAKLLGKIRMAQMQTSSIRIFTDTLRPENKNNPRTKNKMSFDELNRVLPAHEYDYTKEIVISRFTHNRREQGKDLRHKIYETVLEERWESFKHFKFTNDLEKLSQDPDQGNLDGKIAYIYIDGNKFGRLQRDLSEEDLRTFDRMLHGFKKSFLARVLDLVAEYPSFKNSDEVRLETLLWGGDEIKMIVPAWLGWQVALHFFELAQKNNMTMTIDGQRKELTYAMGLVFAHHRNPIRNISKIAEELAEAVKRELTPSTGSGSCVYKRSCGDRMHYMVLESLEALPKGYSAFCEEYYLTQPESLSLSPNDMQELIEFAKDLSTGFPRSRVHSIARASAAKDKKNYASMLQRGLDSLETTVDFRRQLIERIEKTTGTGFDGDRINEKKPDRCYRWLQVVELWDYLVWEEK